MSDLKPVVEVCTDAVYISTSEGQELVCWVLSEVEEEPEVAFVIANALKFVYERGIEEFAETIGIYLDAEKFRCPRCGEIDYGDPTIADHGHCYGCQKQWEWGLWPEQQEED